MSNEHGCEAFLLTCMDFRLHEQIVELLHEQGIKSMDLKCDAGGVKYLISGEKPQVGDWIIENIEISKRLHQIGKVILVNHYDCGAYGGSAAFNSDEMQIDFHKGQLNEAKALLSKRFPDLHVDTYFATLKEGKVGLLPV